MHLLKLWKNIESRLDSELPAWRTHIEDLGQVPAVRNRSKGKSWTDEEVFEALLLAVLSSDTDWSKIEAIRPDLEKLFSGFSLEAYAGRQEAHVVEKLVPWFKSRKAGSRSQSKNLTLLIETAGILLRHSKALGSAESYFISLRQQHGNDPKQVALCLGVPRSEHKLPAFGVPLAAEALKNLGFDVAKPDRHVLRAVAAFGLVDFRPGGLNRQPPGPSPARQLKAMTRVEELAKAAGKRVAYVDNAIWILGAKSGLHLTNAGLAKLAGNSKLQQKDPGALVALLDSWTNEGDADEQQETLEYLIRALDENRPEGYKLFPPELKGKSW